MRGLSLALALLVLACSATEEPAETPVPDAGHEAWVKRTMPLIWGRKPRSINEVSALVQLVEALGRENVVRTMARAPEFLDRWAPFIKDALGVYRIGDPTNFECYGVQQQPARALAAFRVGRRAAALAERACQAAFSFRT